jgi:histidinol-phosphate/aromatic aminotransferase/cobyric acid decarboxylase-like protein
MAFHGGAFWDAVGASFGDLERMRHIVSSDVLDAWFDPSPRVMERVEQYLALALKTSPPTHCQGLVDMIATVRGIPERHIAVGGGSSDLIFAMLPQLIGAQERVLILDPMYGEYAHVLHHLMGATLYRHELQENTGFSVDIDALMHDIRNASPSVVILVNPNSPTGQVVERDRIARLVAAFPATLFVIDETYIEYAGAAMSVERLTQDVRNLMVIKSMSKVFALSGARVGYAVAHPDLLAPAARFIPPWSVSLLGQIAAVEALGDPDYYDARYRETHELRDTMVASFVDAPVTVYPSTTSFFLMRLHAHSAARVLSSLQEEGIYLRNCDSMSPRFNDDYIRVAVKDASANQRVVDGLRKALGDDGLRRDGEAINAMQSSCRQQPVGARRNPSRPGGCA